MDRLNTGLSPHLHRHIHGSSLRSGLLQVYDLCRGMPHRFWHHDDKLVHRVLAVHLGSRPRGRDWLWTQLYPEYCFDANIFFEKERAGEWNLSEWK